MCFLCLVIFLEWSKEGDCVACGSCVNNEAGHCKAKAIKHSCNVLGLSHHQQQLKIYPGPAAVGTARCRVDDGISWDFTSPFSPSQVHFQRNSRKGIGTNPWRNKTSCRLQNIPSLFSLLYTVFQRWNIFQNVVLQFWMKTGWFPFCGPVTAASKVLLFNLCNK